MDTEFDELKREFLAEAEEKVREMEAVLKSPDGDDAVDRVIYLAHQLKGAGGSYGFQEISEDAAALETMLERSRLDDAEPPEPQVRERILRLASEIQSRMREVSATR